MIGVEWGSRDDTTKEVTSIDNENEVAGPGMFQEEWTLTKYRRHVENMYIMTSQRSFSLTYTTQWLTNVPAKACARMSS